MRLCVMGIIGAILLLAAACSDQRTSTPVTVATAITVASVAPTATNLPIPTKAPAPTAIPLSPTPTKAPPTATPTKSPTPAPLGRTRDNPVKKGDKLSIVSKDKGEVEITVTGVNLSADDKIKSYNRFNTLPKLGEKYILVSVSIKNLTKSQEVMLVHSGSFGFVGSSGKILHEAAVVVPQRPDAELFEGGTVTGDIPFLIPAEEKNLLLIYDAASLGGQRYYFALE